jgi:CRP-like cAMP-binding protein
MSPKEKVIQIVLDYIALQPADIKLIEDSLQPVKLKKGSFFIREGMKNCVMCYLDKGLMRSFYIDEEGNEHTTGFYQENAFCTDLYSFRTNKNSQRSIEALMDCEILLINETAQNELINNIENWALFEQNYIAKLLTAKVAFQGQLNKSNSTEAYNLFIDTYDQAARYAPKYQIASFLGISPFTLSRLKIA